MTIQYKHSDTFIFEPETFRLVLETKEIKLSLKESAVLQKLCEDSMRVVDRRAMLTDIWGDSESSDISLNKTILQLRRKFESIGLNGVIDTVPRVGYILKIAIEKQQGDSLAHRAEIIDEDLEVPEAIPTNIIHSSHTSHKPKITQTRLVVLSTIILVISGLIFSVFKLVLSDKNSAQTNHDFLIDIPNDQEQGRTLLFADNLSEVDHTKYMTLSKYIKEDISYYALASKSALSFIRLGSKSETTWQKTFLINPNREIATQIKCIVNYINEYKPQPISVKPLAGMSYVRLNFYRPCGTEDSYLGYILIKSTVNEKSGSTWTQDLSFIDKHGDSLFHLKRFSRALRKSEATALNIKSFHVDYVNQEALQLKPEIHDIFNQFTQDEISLKTIDKVNEIYASSVFGGVLFHVDRF
ncbi:winged helix-turn-helix domain-containing protein [Vibrio cholerae]|uniref:winged helix-turn-helix domain-containing protein n=1 Tax=Vibrio cholerae TaxID=666 RepID=UPI000A117474|nr:winged helix-turn-helix domain-containing protein [Vibrio cholerae]MCX9575602.1 winged helix-turn-helix domain-containing protein [Vibrio cholerae]MDV2388416.1 winged helix-turn-helix domain-containing protein [Vibrio cholerae]ORP17386.1 winged helix family transcriptional regulator [Vibrio cholerae]